MTFHHLPTRFPFDKVLTRTLLSAAALVAIASGRAQILTENFDNVAALPGQGWVFLNHSQNPASGISWFPGNATVFPAHEGATNAYIGANYQSVASGVGTINTWMLTPTLNLRNGDTISFFSRSLTQQYPDRLELRLSTTGASTNVGAGALDVGDFTTLLLSINSTLTVTGYPIVWTQYTVTIAGLDAAISGRLAFRYFVTDGGPNGDNSNYIGVDTLTVTAAPVPEPGACGVCVVALLGGTILFRRRAKRQG